MGYNLQVLNNPGFPKVKVSGDVNYLIILEMMQWCKENDCGYRSAYFEFKFRNKEQVLLFLLRWASNEN